MYKSIYTSLWLCAFMLIADYGIGQPDTIVIGFGQYMGTTVTTSSNTNNVDGEVTLDQVGFLPNMNAASRFLCQSTLGYNIADIQNVTDIGIEDWIDSQLVVVRPDTLLNLVRIYHQCVKDSLMDQGAGSNARFWDYAWWQTHMTAEDVLRQRVAFALSQMLVISDKSAFGGNPYALAGYYDVLMENALGNYRDLLQDVTYHASMGVYLTYLNNPKTDTTQNRFPDENYAREVMQLFTIGTTMLNIDGTMQVDTSGVPIPAYDNIDIQEFSKVFTGLSWSDRTQFNKGAAKDTSYIHPMQMFNEWHEPGVKYLLLGDSIPNSDPVDGHSDITLALNNLFEHPNLPPFVSKFLIQRMVTANPEPAYVQRIAEVFIDNGQGVRGDMKAVVKAILLDPVAKACQSADNNNFGSLREPFGRYFQLNKGLEISTLSGTYRNDMDYIYKFTAQKPLTSPSVFNFFQQDYQPIGAIEDEDLVAPVFQITDAQTIAGYINGLYRFIMEKNIADEYDLFSGEANENYSDEVSIVDFGSDTLLVNDDNIHVLLDKYNMLYAQGRVSDASLDIIKEAVIQFPNETPDQKEDRVQLALYLILTTPEYLIIR